MKIRFIQFRRLLQVKYLSSILMLATSMAALFIANSEYASFYFKLLDQKFTIGFKDFYLSKSVLHWINDGLMTIFFFLIGLEIKGEFMEGTLHSMKRAILPVFAAIGGMAVPIAVFLVLNHNKPGIEGWGIPMATDIAFTLGLLGLLGSKVPLGLKVFLTAFAIIDDIGAVLVITLYYSTSIEWQLVLVALIFIIVLFLFTAFNIYWKYCFLAISLVIWILFLKSGIHPTIAGVLIAFAIPLRRKNKYSNVIRGGREALKELSLLIGQKKKAVDEHKAAIRVLDKFSSEIYSPLNYLQYKLHGLVSFIIIPLFGFANAGISIIGDEGVITHLTWNIAISLVLGKVVGISLFTYIAVKLKIAVLPRFVNFKHVIGLGFLGGLGYTMSIFISNLAYESNELMNSSKIGILFGSIIATFCGFLILNYTLKKQNHA